MEQTTFTASVRPSKKYYQEYGRIHMKKTKISVIYPIIGIVFYAADFCLKAIWNCDVDTYLLTMAATFFVLGLLAGDLSGWEIHRKAKKKFGDSVANYYFGETSFSVNTEYENSNIRYRMIDCIYENNVIFALYLDKALAQIIPKSSFVEGTPVQFRRFMEEKTGKKVKRVHTGSKTALKIVAAVLGFILMLGGMFLADAIADSRDAVLMPYVHKEYQISLPGNFTETEMGDFYFSAGNDDAIVLTVKELRTDMDAITGHETGMEEYVAMVLENSGLTGDIAARRPGGGMDFSYTADGEGETYYYYVVVTQSAEAFYLTNFCCQEAEQGAMIGEFQRWADTITIKQGISAQ